jgi:hypothetical protein
MAMFEPLREGFRELNRLVTDRQTFNAQHESDMARGERANTLLASQLEERAFNRAATEKKILMGAEMNQFEKKMATQRFAESQHQFVTTNAQATARLQNDKDEFTAEQKQDAQQFLETQNMKAEVEARHVVDSQITRELQTSETALKNAKLDKELAYKEKQPFWNIVEGSGLRNVSVETKERVAATIYGALYDEATDTFVDEDGQEIKISAQDQAKVQRRLKGILANENNVTKEHAVQRVGEIDSKLRDLHRETRFKATSHTGDVRNKYKLAKTKAEISSLTKELDEELTKAEVGDVVDRSQTIKDLQPAIVQAYDIGNDDEAKTYEVELADLRAQEKVEREEGKKSGKEKTKTIMIGKRNRAGHLISNSVRAWVYPSGAPDNIKPPEGFETLTGIGIKTKADGDREKMFDDVATRLFGKPEGISGEFVVSVENNVLYEGLKKVARNMREMPKFDHMSDGALASQAKVEQAETMLEYFNEQDRIAKDEPDLKVRELELEKLNIDILDALGSIPDEKQLIRVLKVNQMEDTRELPEDEGGSFKKWFGGGGSM